MNTTLKSNNLEILTSTTEKVKTIMPIFSMYSDYKGIKQMLYIPKDIVLEIDEVYPNYGMDVEYGGRKIFVYDYEVVGI